MNLFCLDFSINDYSLTIRNILTKGAYHEDISKISGAACKLRGKYIANSNQSNSRNPNKTEKPLYLSLQGKSQSSVDLAVQTIKDKIESETQKSLKIARMMKNNDDNQQKQINYSQFQPPAQQLNKIMIGLDHAPANFDLKNRIVGSNGTNLNYIRNETGAMVTLRGRSSMFIDPNTGTESNEPLHLFIDHTNGENLLEARQLAKNLIETIQQDLTIFQQNVQKPNQQMNLLQNNQNGPPPILSVPPPSHIVQSQPAQNFIQTNHPQSQILQQQTQNVPMQIIQQIPPPAIPRTNQPIVQLQQQPANIQIQGANGQPTQILVNQAPQQFQYHIQQNPNQMQINQNPTQQVIQHFITPQQQIQGLQGIIQTPIQTFDQFRQQQGTQQIITVQGNSFMIPPPIIQSNQTPQQNIIYHQPSQQQIIHQMPLEMNTQEDLNIKKEMTDKEKHDSKMDCNHQIVQIQQMPPNTRTILAGPMIQLNHPPPILSVPPPNMQIIAHPPVSHPNPQQQQQSIFGNQIPVTLQQQIQQGQHFIVNSQWQQNNNQHQFTQAPMIQAPQTRNCNDMMVNEQVQQNDFRNNPQQIIAFNPQMQSNMQIQFQQPNMIENHSPNFIQPPQQFQPMRQNIPMEQHITHLSQQPPQNAPQPNQRPGMKRKMIDEKDTMSEPLNSPKIKGIGPKSTVGGKPMDCNAAPPLPSMMPMFNSKMKPGNNSMKLNVNNYNNKPINKFNKIAATSAANNSTITTATISQIKGESAPTSDDVDDSKIGIKLENPETGDPFEGQKTQPPNQGQMIMINQPPGNHFIRGPGNNQNFRFGPPGNSFMGQQPQQGVQFQQGPQMMQHPPPNFQGPQFNQPRLMMNNFHQNQQLMPPQGGPPLHQQQQQRPFMQDMRSFGPPPPPPSHNDIGNYQQMMHHPQQTPRFRQQW